MATELTNRVREQVAKSLGVPLDGVYCTVDGEVIVVTATGEPRGQSVRYAARRRKRAQLLAKRIADAQGVEVSISFAVHDAVSALEDLVRVAAELVLGRPSEDVHVNIGRRGRASVLVSLSRDEDDAKKQLTDAITPLLRRTGLSPVTVSVVSPAHEGVADGRLLRVAKVLSPCDAGTIARSLRQTDRIDIAVDTVHRRLDILRQRGLLVYLGDRKYALSVKGLSIVPTSKRRDSSDVERALALAKRRW